MGLNPIQVEVPPVIPPIVLNGGTPPVIVVPVTNTGSVPLVMNNFEIPGPDGTNGYFYVDYTYAAACPSFTILAPGAHCNIAMSLTGYTSAGTVTGYLIVHGFSLDGAGLDRVGFGAIAQNIN